MEMTEHQERLWTRMIELIQEYLDGHTWAYTDVVGGLEGALDASELKDNALVDRWYELWTPLETRRAVEGNDPDKEEVRQELMSMREFLLRRIRRRVSDE